MAQNSSFTVQQLEHLHRFVSTVNTTDLATLRLYCNYMDENMKAFKAFLTTEEQRENRLLNQHHDIATRYKRAWANNHDHFCQTLKSQTECCAQTRWYFYTSMRHAIFTSHKNKGGIAGLGIFHKSSEGTDGWTSLHSNRKDEDVLRFHTRFFSEPTLLPRGNVASTAKCPFTFTISDILTWSDRKRKQTSYSTRTEKTNKK